MRGLGQMRGGGGLGENLENHVVFQILVGGGGFIESKRDEGRSPSAHLRGVDDCGMQCHVVLVLNGYSRERKRGTTRLFVFSRPGTPCEHPVR